MKQELVPIGTAAKLAGVNRVQIAHWIVRNLVSLDAIREKAGTKHHRFSLLDVKRIALIGRLTKFGVTTRSASNIADKIVTSKGSQFFVVFDKHRKTHVLTQRASQDTRLVINT